MSPCVFECVWYVCVTNVAVRAYVCLCVNICDEAHDCNVVVGVLMCWQVLRPVCSTASQPTSTNAGTNSLGSNIDTYDNLSGSTSAA